MNILWIEDFGGNLPANEDTLSVMFKELVGENFFATHWDDDEYSLLDDPACLARFFAQHSPLHRVELCRHYFDFAAFLQDHDPVHDLDAVIIDIRLDRDIDWQQAVPDDHDPASFHREAGFYIYNQLIYLGFPADNICILTGERNSLDGFERRCHEIFLQKPHAFEKIDSDYNRLRSWLTQRAQCPYRRLRRGIITACRHLRELVAENPDCIRFGDFIKLEQGEPIAEITGSDLQNYLAMLERLLPVQAPQTVQERVAVYRLLLRALAHEWEKTDMGAFRKRFPNWQRITDLIAYGWIMKNARNWSAHSNQLDPLDEAFLAFLFLVNLRAMFKLPATVQNYERQLLECLPGATPNSPSLQQIRDRLAMIRQDIDEHAHTRGIASGNFGWQVNAIYIHDTGNPDAASPDFKRALFHLFWINQERRLGELLTAEDTEAFLPTLARQICWV